jgi:putative addiction module component (TIGR02574 family)
MSADTLLDTALKLPAADRARIAAELIASLDGEPEAGAEAAWLVEIDQRIKDVDEGRVQLRDWSDVKADVQDALRRK